MPKAGDRAPDFSLASSDGGTVALASFRGVKNVVLYFYPKDDTPGCTVQACKFRDDLSQYAGHDAVVLGVSGDDLKSHGKFRDKFKLSFPLLADTSTATAQAYGVWVEKKMYGNKKLGIQRATFLIGKDGKIAHVWPKVSVEGHSDEVLAALRELNGGDEAEDSEAAEGSEDDADDDVRASGDDDDKDEDREEEDDRHGPVGYGADEEDEA